MPKYNYFCKTCQEKFSIRHGLQESIVSRPTFEQECQLEKIPSLIRKTVSKPNKQQKVGMRVKKFIEDTKKDLKEEKQLLSQELET